ncbi:MAG: M23 family metallopeptidase [Burkholderiales bacterium]|nr:M23 family metallopeptidase [Burkholderiales bacterium]
MRKLIALVLVVAVLGSVAFLGFRVGPPPEISIAPAAEMIGRRTPVTVTVSEPERGVGKVTVELVQGDAVQTLAQADGDQSPAWAIWRSGTPNSELRFDVGKETIKNLEPGTATIRVSADRAGGMFWSAAPEVKQVELPVRLVPPTLQVMSTFTYVAQGGSEAVVYRVGESARRDGVRAGDRFFPGYPLPGGGPQDRFALFAVPYDLNDAGAVMVVASDAAGNEAQARFIDKFFPRPLRTDTIRLDDGFMQKVTTEIMTQTPSLADKGNLLDNYLQINRDLRMQNMAFRQEIAARTQPAFLWREPFLAMVNTAIKASFADRRSYLYNEQAVDQQDHLGLDMASTRADKVPAANDGVVVYAGYLGIYGNCVILDHGYGVQTLYGHLSAIDVKEGDKVTRGQPIARSGASGLAGGDHLHFEVVLHGLPVTPIEWFDSKWINDRLKLKLGGALPFGEKAQ